MSAFEFSKLQISFCVVKHYFKIMEEIMNLLKGKHSFLKNALRVHGFKISHSSLKHGRQKCKIDRKKFYVVKKINMSLQIFLCGYKNICVHT